MLAAASRGQRGRRKKNVSTPICVENTTIAPAKKGEGTPFNVYYRNGPRALRKNAKGGLT